MILCTLGCGTLGSSIIAGILDSDHRDRFDEYIACVKRKESAARIRKDLGIEATIGKNPDSVSRADIVILACKPQACRALLSEKGMETALEGKLLVSILAGTTLAQLREMCPADSTRIVRAMPNTPCKLRQGMTVISCGRDVPDCDRETVLDIFSTIGRAMLLDEKHMDACTALCGSGPAFAAVMLEAMADGGVMMGIPRPEAQLLAAQTMQGTARMVLEGQHPALIRSAVATPGGCTISGLLTMEDGGIRSTLARTIQQATERAAQLGKEPPPH